MCSSYIIDGNRCETGRDLVLAIGRTNAALVNTNVLPDQITEDEWLACCLCHVDRNRLQELTGIWYEINSEVDFDAYVPTPS